MAAALVGRRRGPRPLAAACAALAIALGAGRAAARAPQDDLGATHYFRTPVTREARTLAEEALAALDAERWDDAAEALHALVAAHGGAVLPREFSDERSQTAVLPGAAAWAAARVRELPEPGLAAWRARLEADARAALDEALRRGRRRELAECARRYPLTEAGAEAELALGDLELERGDADDARAAWTRALDALRRLGADASPAERRLATLAASAPEPPRRSDGTHRAGLVLPGPGGGGGPIPLRDADPWALDERTLDLEPFDRQGRLEEYNLFPVLAEGRVLVSTSLRVYAVDAYAPEVLWSAGPPAGWSLLDKKARHELFSAIDHRSSLVAPAVGGGVVVAALQIPYSHLEPEDYQGITITSPIPERRLFAYDLESGAEIWNHAPPLAWNAAGGSFSWDGESGSYAQRMLVAGSPVVAGSRVLVPCYRMRGRIDLHVVCYDLYSGERLWSTSLVSGQRELNMFGRHVEEYAAPPVAVAGDRVVVLTQLGTVAALDLFGGSILWETEYEQIPLPETRTWNPPRRPVVWLNAPPVVAGGVAVVTPTDSFDILGLDVATGAVLWAYPYNRLPGGPSPDGDLPFYDVLLGADEDAVYLGGSCVSKLRKPGGLGERRAFFQPEWTQWLDEEDVPRRLPRPVLAAEEVLLPTFDARVVVDRDDGSAVSRKAAPWTDRERGNAVVGEGMLFLLGNQRLRGFFDWQVLLERADAALAERPDDPAARRGRASLLLRRARALQNEGRGEEALALLADARGSLAALAGGPSGAADAESTGLLFRCLRAEADVRVALADGDGALAALREALPLAQRPTDVRDVLLAEEEVLRERPDLAAWLALLARLDERCGGLPMPPEALARSSDWLVGESLLSAGVLDPEAEVPVGLWVVLARATAAARRGDTASALEDLHLALERHGERRLAFGLTVRDVVLERIDRRLELDGEAAYAPFEERARELLERARSAGDAALLASVSRLYPRARAAREAARLSLDWAFERGDPQRTAELVRAALSGAPAPDADDALALLRLGAAMERAGNEALARGLWAALVRAGHGDLASDLAVHEGRTIAELSAAAEAAAPAGAGLAPTPHFGAGLALRGAGAPGMHRFRGVVAPEAPRQEAAPVAVAVLSRGARLVGHLASAPGEPAWTVELEVEPPPEGVVLPPGLVVAAAGEELLALVAETGDVAWRRSLGGRVTALAEAEGVVLAVADDEPAPTAGGERAVAIDVRGGTLLWELALGERPQWWPLAGEGRAVLLNKRYHLDARARVVDLFRGVVVSEIEIDRDVDPRPHLSAWIEDGRLAVPVFTSSRGEPSRLSVYDLDAGALEWSHELPSGREIHAVVASRGKSYVIELPSGLSRTQAGEISEVDLATRAWLQVATLRPGDEPAGIPPRRRTELAEPLLFLVSSAESTSVQMIDLELRAPAWTYHLPWSADEIDRSGWARPAVSQELVVLPFATRSLTTRQREGAYIELVDRNGGFKRGRLVLPQDVATSAFELHPLGAAVLVVADPPAARLAVLEDDR